MKKKEVFYVKNGEVKKITVPTGADYLVLEGDPIYPDCYPLCGNGDTAIKYTSRERLDIIEVYYNGRTIDHFVAFRNKQEEDILLEYIQHWKSQKEGCK